MSSQIGDFNGGRMTPQVHSGTSHSGAAASELAGLTPTYNNWTQAPGTTATITKETGSRVLDTNGIGAVGENNIVWDLVTSLRRMVYLWDLSGFLGEIDFSEDGITWYTMFALGAADLSGFGCEKFRYLKYAMSGVHTITQLRVLVYDIN